MRAGRKANALLLAQATRLAVFHLSKGAITTDSIYNEVKQRLDLIGTAQHYGLQPNRSGFVNCIFHKEKTPSLKLYPAHFHCYGCGKHGDIITLTTQLFTLPPYEAAQKLAQDFHIVQGNIYKDMKPRISEQMKYYEQEQKTFRWGHSSLILSCKSCHSWRRTSVKPYANGKRRA